MSGPVADLATESMARIGHHLEERLLGSRDPDQIAARISEVCGRLGQVRDGVFYEAGVGLVVGVRLAAGRAVVVKVHWWNASLERLTACLAVQTHLHEAGLPAPRPLLPVVPVGSALATVEELVVGDMADGRLPEVRRAMAAGFHRLIESARSMPVPVALEPVWRQTSPDAPLWPAPHDTRFDFAATADGAEWIDDHGRRAFERLRRSDSGAPVVGHIDWRVQNLAFDGDGIIAIYDWDSVAVGSEAVFVGNAAAVFTTDWRVPHPDPPPTVDEMRAFVTDYEHARGHPFRPAEREALDAANLAMIAYAARCQHSDQLLCPDLGDHAAIGWPRLLRERGDRCLV